MNSEADKLRIAADKAKKKTATLRLANGGAALPRGRKKELKTNQKKK